MTFEQISFNAKSAKDGDQLAHQPEAADISRTAAELVDLAARPIAGQVQVLEDIHDSLRDALI